MTFIQNTLRLLLLEAKQSGRAFFSDHLKYKTIERT